MPDPPTERARLVAGIAGQLDALARRRERARTPPSPHRPLAAPAIPPSPEHRRRWRRARHWKARVIVLKHLVNLVTMLAVLACIGVIYRALSIYAARGGYRLSADVARVGFALFLGGVLTGGIIVYAVMAGKRTR